MAKNLFGNDTVQGSLGAWGTGYYGDNYEDIAHSLLLQQKDLSTEDPLLTPDPVGKELLTD